MPLEFVLCIQDITSFTILTSLARLGEEGKVDEVGGVG